MENLNLQATESEQAQLWKRVDQAFAEHYAKVPESVRAELREAYTTGGYCKLSNFAPPELIAPIREEAHALFARNAVRRNMRMAVTSNTPRILSNVRSIDVAAQGKLIPAMYFSPALMDFLGQIFGEPCYVCPYENERFMLLSLSQADDTHGWHWDDYAFSLIWFIEVPRPEQGGVVEFVPHTTWDKHDPDIVHRYLREREVQQRIHVRDDVYLLRGDTCMHRVTPLREDAFRLVLNLAWANQADLERPSVSHETLDGLYS
jgi:hypothetical protein